MNLGARLEGRHVLVTGATEALGAHFAEVSARCGAAVTVAGASVGELQRLVARLQESGAARAGAIEHVAADESSTEAAFAALRDDAVDVLINISDGGAGADREQGRLAPDLRAVWLNCTAAARGWRDAKRGGVVVNVAPDFGVVAGGGAVPQGVSRAGIVQMTAVLALEWARYGIRVNALAPGYLERGGGSERGGSAPNETLMKRIPLRRLGRPEDLDGAFLLLATDASAWMTGTTITVDGGHLVTSL